MDGGLLESHCGNLASLSSWDEKQEPCKSKNIVFFVIQQPQGEAII